MHNDNNFKIEEHRRKVAYLIAQSTTENGIPHLQMDKSIIGKDVRALEMSQQFVFDLAKSDLAYY
jgi:hypothetical protein